jgi:hypothetical protein
MIVKVELFPAMGKLKRLSLCGHALMPSALVARGHVHGLIVL